MLGNNAAYQSAPQVEKPTIHAGLTTINTRLYDLSCMAEGVITRLHGPRLADTPLSQKDAREPSTSDHLSSAHLQLTRLEDQLREIAAFIG